MGEDEVLVAPEHLNRLFEQQDPQYHFETLLGQLRTGMRTYDETRHQLQGIKEATAETDTVLEVVEPHHLPSDYPPEIAYAALRRFMLARAAEPLESELRMQRFYSELPLRKELLGHVAMIETVEPDGVRLTTHSENRFGQLEGLGKFTPKAKGIIHAISWSEATGGSIILRAKMRNRYYQAAPLIDRERDYHPNYRVTILK